MPWARYHKNTALPRTQHAAQADRAHLSALHALLMWPLPCKSLLQVGRDLGPHSFPRHPPSPITGTG